MGRSQSLFWPEFLKKKVEISYKSSSRISVRNNRWELNSSRIPVKKVVRWMLLVIVYTQRKIKIILKILTVMHFDRKSMYVCSGQVIWKSKVVWQKCLLNTGWYNMVQYRIDSWWIQSSVRISTYTHIH